MYLIFSTRLVWFGTCGLTYSVLKLTIRIWAMNRYVECDESFWVILDRNVEVGRRMFAHTTVGRFAILNRVNSIELPVHRIKMRLLRYDELSAAVVCLSHHKHSFATANRNPSYSSPKSNWSATSNKYDPSILLVPSALQPSIPRHTHTQTLNHIRIASFYRL